ncbi:TonB-like protein [Flavobacterium croceum DSM 17960]|uniref:TonB-like protein n=1 Tax=Flavobacterium croceum DSM 17960 TaxID=1121886 RepID=A0A2S4N514_9FLAO|nr:energy transducer TonB [Flavobacterium croceum]POS00824.1 TonB-like protein [Flavobacterium croceum DSM 17960]
MKKILLFLSLFLVQYAYTQTSESVKTENTKDVELLPSPENTSKVYNMGLVDTTPEYPGGMSEFYKFVSKNYRVPNVDKLKGKVIVSFIVDKDGSVYDVKVLRDVGFGTGNEAIRVFKLMPKWKPAIQNDKPVRCKYLLPISISTE